MFIRHVKKPKKKKFYAVYIVNTKKNLVIKYLESELAFFFKKKSTRKIFFLLKKRIMFEKNQKNFPKHVCIFPKAS